MPYFYVTTGGQAESNVPADHGTVKIEVSACSKTAESARRALDIKKAALEARLGQTAEGSSALKTSPNNEGGAEFVLVDDNHSTGRMSPPGRDNAASRGEDGPLKDMKRLLDGILPDSISGIESWTKSAVEIDDGGNYSLPRPVQRKKKSRKPTYYENLVNVGDFVPYAVASTDYKIEFSNLVALAAFVQNTHEDITDCKVTGVDFSLQPATKAAAETRLREAAAKDALTQARDYCNGLQCNSKTTKIAPVEIITAVGAKNSKRNEQPISSPNSPMPPYSNIDCFGLPTASPEPEVHEQDWSISGGPMTVSLKHTVEVVFKIETDKLALFDIGADF